jgi:hypothetical protein
MSTVASGDDEARRDVAADTSPAAPGYWVAATSAVSALTLFFSVRETKGDSLEHGS